MVCCRYLIGQNSSVVYLSDITAVPESTAAVLEQIGEIEVLVVDTLFEERRTGVHFTLIEALDLIRKLRPKKSLLVGMADQIEHHSTNRKLAELLQTEGLDVQLAHDGLAIEMAL